MTKLIITNRAGRHLREAERFSKRKWGGEQTELYMSDLLSGLADIAQNPEKGRVRRYRSAPFLMAPIREHFALYDTIGGQTIIVAVLHSRRDIEGIVSEMAEQFKRDIAAKMS